MKTVDELLTEVKEAQHRYNNYIGTEEEVEALLQTFYAKKAELESHPDYIKQMQMKNSLPYKLKQHGRRILQSIKRLFDRVFHRNIRLNS